MCSYYQFIQCLNGAAVNLTAATMSCESSGPVESGVTVSQDDISNYSPPQGAPVIKCLLFNAGNENECQPDAAHWDQKVAAFDQSKGQRVDSGAAAGVSLRPLTLPRAAAG